MHPSSAFHAAHERMCAGKIADAIPYYEAGLALHPDAPNAWLSLACALGEMEKLDAAIVCARKAVDLAPRDVNALKNLGSLMYRAERYGEARVWLEEAASVAPAAWTLLLDLALVDYAQGNLASSEEHFVQAIAGAPNDHVRRTLSTHMAYPVLAAGDYVRGLELYDNRFQEIARTQVWDWGVPEWKGEDLTGKHILIHHDQGDGDTIQFSRFMPRAGRCTLAVPKRMMRLLARLSVDVDLVDLYGDLPVSDYHSPICSMPRWLGMPMPGWGGEYLGPIPGVVIPKLRPKFMVGLVWSARPIADGARRSIPLEQLLPLAEIPGVKLYGVQVGEAAKDIERLGAGSLVDDVSYAIRDWQDTADLMSQMDMIVSVDSAPLHLAGAMGKMCVGLLTYRTCWRWGINTDKTPWYPTMTLYRQAAPKDWSGPILRLRHLIENRVESERLAHLMQPVVQREINRGQPTMPDLGQEWTDVNGIPLLLREPI